MIEIIIGLLCLVAGFGMTAGIASGGLRLGGLEFVAGILIAAIGAVLLAHGVFRRVRDRRDGDQYQLRSGGLTVATLLGAALIVIFGIAVFGQITISGLPIGYHAVAEGVPLALFILFLIFKRTQASIDRDATQNSNASHEAHNGI